MGVLDGCHKIGFSNDPELRAKNLSRGGSPLRVVHAIATSDMRWLERVMHAAHAHARVGGEWFRLTDDDVVNFSGLTEVHDDDDLLEIYRPFSDATYARSHLPDFAPRQPGFMVRLPDELRGPLEARSAVTGRTLTTELVIATVRHLTAEPEAAPSMKLPKVLPTGDKPAK